MNKFFLSKDINSRRKKNYIFAFISIVILFFIWEFFLVGLDNKGFSNIKALWKINSNLFIIIPVSAIGLGISSFLIQEMSKNKLGDSSILGIGNINIFTLSILIFIVDYGSSYSINNYKKIFPYLFILVSVLLTIFIFFISYKKNCYINKKFVLVGIIFNFTLVIFFNSISKFLPPGKSAAINSFVNGFLDNSEDNTIIISVVSFCIAFFWLIFIIDKFRIINTNSKIASQLGINVNSINFQILIIVGIFTGAAFNLVGNIVFLGLLSGNISKTIFRKNYNYAVPSSGLISTIILLMAFVINKNIFSTNINTTQIIPIFGIPYFIYLIFKEK